MNYRKLRLEILEILNKNPELSFTLYDISEEMGKAEEGKKITFRNVLSRCLNRMRKEGIVDWRYRLFEQTPNFPLRRRGKYWFIVPMLREQRTSLQRLETDSYRHVR